MFPFDKYLIVRFPLVLGLIFSFVLFYPVFAQEVDKRAEIKVQIQKLEDEADAIDKSLAATEKEKLTLANEVDNFNNEIKRRELNMKRLTLAINEAAVDINTKTKDIATLSDKIDVSKKALASGLFTIYSYEQDSILEVLLKHDNLSSFFSSFQGLVGMQTGLQATMQKFADNQQTLQKERDDLENFEEDQQQLKSLQVVERKFLEQKKQEKDEILRLTKGKESLFQQLLKSKKQDIATLKTQLFYLEKTGITAEDATHFADLAAKRTGIRTAFLLALLEVETGKQFEDGVISVGTNLGTGNWQKDLYTCYIKLKKPKTAEAEKAAFLEITGKLNLDPDSMPVSRKPNYGCGGAMGPAQFLPSTWLRFDDRVSQLTGHNPPNPWNVEDAFTAAALFLADAGADGQNPTGEAMAAKTYISGQPKCTKYVCNSYANRILSLAKDIDQIL